MLIEYNHEKFDPNWIIALVKEQEPERVDIINALGKCTKGQWKNRVTFTSLILKKQKKKSLNGKFKS